MINRRSVLAGLAAAPVVLSSAIAQEAPKEIRIGYQKSGVLLIAKAQGLLEKRFAAIGATVKWVEFTFGPPLLEALNTGAIDYGTVGDAPPVFAQAARANLLYTFGLQNSPRIDSPAPHHANRTKISAQFEGRWPPGRDSNP